MACLYRQQDSSRPRMPCRLPQLGGGQYSPPTGTLIVVVYGTISVYVSVTGTFSATVSQTSRLRVPCRSTGFQVTRLTVTSRVCGTVSQTVRVPLRSSVR